MSTLFDRTIAQSYTELLKTASTSGVTADLTIVEDGDATASALQISSSKVKSSGSLEVVGPVNFSSLLSVDGSSTLTGNVSMGGDLTVAGNAVIQGTLTANGGTLTLGDADTDNVVFNADINSHILPNTDNTYDLGSAAKSWRNLYLDGDLYLNGTAALNNLSIAVSQTISATTQSTDKDTGALVVEGGVGVEKNVNVGGTLAVTGTTTLTGNTSVAGTLGVTGATLLSSTLGVADTISATKASGTGLAVTSNATIGGNLTVSGDLTINGTTTNINTTNLVVEDKNVVLADVATPTNTTADGGGITLKGATDKTLNWVNSTSAWTSSENVDVASSKTYKINGTDVLSNNTLGSGVTSSSLTSVGTIGTGIWQGTIINPTYGGTGVNNESKTITLGGNLTTSGAFATTLASTANTNVTLPTTGTLATLANAETLTNKTLTSPTISSIVNTGTLTLPSGTDTLVGRATTDTLTNKTLTSPVLDGTTTTVSGNLVIGAAAYIVEVRGGGSTEGAIQLNCSANTHGQKVKAQPHAQAASNTLLLPGGTTIGNSDAVLVSDTGTQTLTNKTLTTPIISSISNTGTITLPTGTDTLVGRATTDTLTNKTINLSSNTLQATSAELATAISDETGTGSLVFANSPTLVTPTLGAASATSLSLSTPLSPANGGTGLSTTSAAAAGKILGVAPNGSTHEYKTLTPGTGISITDSAGIVTITNTGSGSVGGGGGSASGAVAIYRYNATAGQTVFSGVDTSTPPTTLVYTPNYLSVFLNGVKLDDSDFTATNGTSVTLNVACVATDDVDVVAFGSVPQLASPGLANYVVGTTAGGTALEYKQIVAGTGVSIAQGVGSLTISAGGSPLSAPLASFRYIASANQTVFTGSDSNGNPLGFTPGFLYVFVNGVLLAPSLDYTTTSTTTITLTSGCSLSDFVDILAFGQVTTVGLTDSSVTTAKLNQTAGSEAVTTATIRDGAVTAAKLEAGAAVPSQTGNSGKYLTTNGTTAAWQTSPVGFRNRIINGDMRIDQRNAGASVTPSSTSYTLDRWSLAISGAASKLSIQQSTTAPDGYKNSTVATVVASYSPASSDVLIYQQAIEGFNFGDLAWGTSSAQAIAISFWVRSSLIGTYSVMLLSNGTGGTYRNYIATYSISSANVWEKKTITVSGDTSGTWDTGNTTGLYIAFDLGSGSGTAVTAGSWANGVARKSTGANTFVSQSNGATWYITGVQLEAGSTATDFERRPIGTELALCQRYTYRHSAEGDNDNYAPLGMGRYFDTNNAQLYVPFKVTMRAPPSSVTQVGNIAVNNVNLNVYAITLALNETASSGATVAGTTTSGTTAGNATTFYANNTANAALIFEAEL